VLLFLCGLCQVSGLIWRTFVSILALCGVGVVLDYLTLWESRNFCGDMSTFSDVVCWSCPSELRLIAFNNCSLSFVWVVRLPLLTIGSYIQWLFDLSLRAPFAASSSITRSIGMIPVMMSIAAPHGPLPLVVHQSWSHCHCQCLHLYPQRLGHGLNLYYHWFQRVRHHNTNIVW